jgi:hypothetical protein
MPALYTNSHRSYPLLGYKPITSHPLTRYSNGDKLLPMTNKDKTGTARQQARRKREREWLAAYGLNSWEALHTQLMRGDLILIRPAGKPPTGQYIIKKGKQS